MSQAAAAEDPLSAETGQLYDAATNVVETSGLLGELGFSSDSLVQEIGVDDDVDDAFRDALEDLLDEPLVDEDDDEVVDAVLLWFREGDGDLTDALVDSLTTLDEGGVVWLLTPRSGRDGYVAPVEIQDAAPNAGLHVTSSAGVCAHWAAARLMPRK
ncbi:hypothetical protein HNR09_003106 [Nesterenkonia xinjiangensis]|uniref:DUF3052 domain-containing protein n=1 Tax=Nesterenkonia xinjiangensis TaxID=225327 RepID=A0A7Z0GPC0_9MICC|nr:DUF3052 domain-containing protein [Nesterenkonia sp. HG001]MDZ5078320.1 DUF3052 domain-containing protein [Nesterenkonia sp. HG001]NYJ79695.1 hypothetical protein [Nesterenkonia xinjiangensis]